MQTALSLFETAREAHEQGDTEQAYDQYTQAYHLAKQQGIHVPGLVDYFAELCVSVGDKKLAKTLYKESIQAEPNLNPQKYLSFAQLETGLRAAEMYKTGIQMLTLARDVLSPDTEEYRTLNSSIASAYAAIVELYMTDLCDEATAEEICETCVAKAISTDPMCVDGHQALANLRLVRARLPEARAALDQVILLLQNLGESNMPTPEFLAETARMFVELEAWPQVVEVTSIGIHISEEADLLYMHAFAKYKLGSIEECRDAVEVLREKLKEEPDVEIEEALAELETQIASAMDTD